MAFKPIIELSGRAGNQAEQGELVDDAIVEAGGFEEEGERLWGEAIEFREGVCGPAEHFRGENIGLLAVENVAESFGEELVGLGVIDTPDDGVSVILLKIGGGEMHGHQGGEGPVEQAGGQAMVLGQGEPIPDGIAGDGIAVSVLAEVTQQVSFGVAGKAGKGGTQIGRGLGDASIGEVGAESGEGFLPSAGVELFVQVAPG